MQCKLDQLRDAAAAGDWRTALSIAAKFDRLGEHEAAIKRAHEALWHPEWARQLGRDPEACVRNGIEALRARYRLG